MKHPKRQIRIDSVVAISSDFVFNTMEKHYLKKLAEIGFSIIPCNETKAPLGAWKKYQTESRTVDQVESLTSPKFGIVTGFNNLEVFDIDCKTLSTLK